MSTLTPLDNFYIRHEEPVKSCLQFLRTYILNLNNDVTEKWLYGAPFFYYKGKRFCYIWIDRKLKHPYIGIVDGKLIEHPDLILGNRSRMKIFMVDPAKDIPLKKINAIMKKTLALYK